MALRGREEENVEIERIYFEADRAGRCLDSCFSFRRGGGGGGGGGRTTGSGCFSGGFYLCEDELCMYPLSSQVSQA